MAILKHRKDTVTTTLFWSRILDHTLCAISYLFFFGFLVANFISALPVKPPSFLVLSLCKHPFEGCSTFFSPYLGTQMSYSPTKEFLKLTYLEKIQTSLTMFLHSTLFKVIGKYAALTNQTPPPPFHSFSSLKYPQMPAQLSKK